MREEEEDSFHSSKNLPDGKLAEKTQHERKSGNRNIKPKVCEHNTERGKPGEKVET